VIQGVVAAIKWQYYTAAAINGYSVARTKQGQWSASGIVVLADAFKMAQRPLVFVAKHKKGEWRWPIQSMAIGPDGHRWTATLGPPLP
jgi:hypothetical protein